MLAGAMRVCDFILLAVVVLAARYLGAERFGLFMFSLTLATVVLSPFSEAFTPTMAKTAARAPRRVGADLGAIIPFQVLLMVAFLLVGWVAMRWAHWEAGRQYVVLMMLVALGVRGPLELLRSAVRGLGRFDVELITILVERLLLLASAAAVLLLGRGPLWLASCFVATRLISIAVALQWVVRLGHVIRWGWQEWWRHIREALPYGMTKWVSANYDQVGILCLGWLATDAATGAYSAAFRLIDGLSSFPQMLVLVLLPELTVRHGLAPDRVAPLVRKTVAYTAMVTLPLMAALLVEAPWIITTIYGAGYGAAVRSFRILVIGMLCLFTKEIARTTLWALDREGIALVVMVGGLALNAALTVWLIPVYGAAAAAIAMAGSGLAVWTALWVVLNRRGIGWPLVEAAIKPGAVALAVALGLLALHGMAWPVRIAGGCAIALVMLVATKAVTPVEWDLLRSVSGRLMVRFSR